jgi:hypothetical protein
MKAYFNEHRAMNVYGEVEVKVEVAPHASFALPSVTDLLVQLLGLSVLNSPL